MNAVVAVHGGGTAHLHRADGGRSVRKSSLILRLLRLLLLLLVH